MLIWEIDMRNRSLIIFLVINFILAVTIIISLNGKKNNSVSNMPAATNSQEKLVSSVISNPAQPASIPASNSKVSLCMVYGPIGIEQKATLDTIFSQEKIETKTVVDKKTQYEIYWNLGRDKNIATELFNRQKAGPLQDPKFKLTNSDGTWMVSIATVTDSIDNAKTLAGQLAAKANKVNSGGNWQYRTLPDAYFYQLKDVNALSAQALAQINTGMDISRKPCLN